MALPADLVSRYDADRVVREDLSDVIEMIANEDTPFISNIGRSRAEQTMSEWNTDALKSPDPANAVVEGADAVSVQPVATLKMANFTQIMTKWAGVTGTVQAINVVGGQKQLARELMKAGRELKLDREARFVSLLAAAQGSDSVARQTAGLGAWLKTNKNRGATATEPTMSGTNEGWPTAGPTGGTDRAFTEAQVKDVMAQAWGQGGKPKMMMLSGPLKQKASTFPGIAANRVNLSSDANAARIIGTADIYVSDFGNLSIVPNVCMGVPATNATKTVYLVDPEQAEMRTLRNIQTIELAKTGDSDKREMIWEGMLKVNNEKAHGVISNADPAL